MKTRAAAILGLGSSAKHVQPFARDSDAAWQFGLPASNRDADVIVVFGGDGTVHRHLAPLVALRLPVLVVPRGSGNDFARALYLRGVRDSLHAWRQFASGRGKVRQIDLGVITSLNAGGAPAPHEPSLQTSGNQKSESRNYFCCVGGIGLDAEIARLANQLPRWIRSRGGYLLSLLPALSAFIPPAVTVHASETDMSSGFTPRHDGPAMVVAFANAPNYGGGIKIAPKARLDDGQLDICVVGNMGKARLLRLFPSVYSGSHLRIPEVKYFQTARLRLETERPMEVYADGEYVCCTPVEVTVERAALRVIVLAAQTGL
jgi:diacylglycerol kinase (ATP)